jgi:HEPN domain-containing protein
MTGGERYATNAKAWRVQAEFVFESSKQLFESGSPATWFSAAILGHHALEMLLKSALFREGFPAARGRPSDGFVWGHNLVDLARLLASKRADFPLEQSAEVLARFDAFFNELRYPADLDKVEELSEDDKYALVELVNHIRPFASPFTDTSFD